jgi:hypothetical protein
MDMVKMKHRVREEPPLVQKVKNEDIKKPRYKLWIVALLSVAFLISSVSFILASAVVTVNPKTADIVLNEDLSACKDASAGLPFDLIAISGEQNKIIQTTQEKDISQRAEGVVVLYNAFSSAPQTLNIDTKLLGSNGKIYKTQTRTVVPGRSASGTPGSVTVKIYGAAAGDEYNSVPLDFKIVNFKGGPKYSKFYGRSQGEITGGLVGKFPYVADDQKMIALGEMKTALTAELIKKASGQIPSGFILFDNAAFLVTDDEGSIDYTAAKDAALPLSVKGTLYGFLFDIDKLTKKIAEDKIPEYDGSPVYMPNVRDLTFTLSKSENVSFADVKDINFKLSGTAKIVWKLDADKLTGDLLGKPKNDFSRVLLQYPNINSANLVLSPIWKMSIPDKTKDIKVIVNYPK